MEDEKAVRDVWAQPMQGDPPVDGTAHLHSADFRARFASPTIPILERFVTAALLNERNNALLQRLSSFDDAMKLVTGYGGTKNNNNDGSTRYKTKHQPSHILTPVELGLEQPDDASRSGDGGDEYNNESTTTASSTKEFRVQEWNEIPFYALPEYGAPPAQESFAHWGWNSMMDSFKHNANEGRARLENFERAMRFLVSTGVCLGEQQKRLVGEVTTALLPKLKDAKSMIFLRRSDKTEACAIVIAALAVSQPMGNCIVYNSTTTQAKEFLQSVYRHLKIFMESDEFRWKMVRKDACQYFEIETRFGISSIKSYASALTGDAKSGRVAEPTTTTTTTTTPHENDEVARLKERLADMGDKCAGQAREVARLERRLGDLVSAKERACQEYETRLSTLQQQHEAEFGAKLHKRCLRYWQQMCEQHQRHKQELDTERCTVAYWRALSEAQASELVTLREADESQEREMEALRGQNALLTEQVQELLAVLDRTKLQICAILQGQ